jgi:hypothetical protein
MEKNKKNTKITILIFFNKLNIIITIFFCFFFLSNSSLTIKKIYTVCDGTQFSTKLSTINGISIADNILSIPKSTSSDKTVKNVPKIPKIPKIPSPGPNIAEHGVTNDFTQAQTGGGDIGAQIGQNEDTIPEKNQNDQNIPEGGEGDEEAEITTHYQFPLAAIIPLAIFGGLAVLGILIYLISVLCTCFLRRKHEQRLSNTHLQRVDNYFSDQLI